MVTEFVLETPAPVEPSRRRDFGSSARLWAGFFGRAWLWFLAGCLIVTFLPMLFGWRPYVVESGSMTPRIKVGDVIMSSPEHDPNKLLGHVAIFNDPDPSRAGTTKSHRIVRINPDGTLVSKGDANPTVDPVPVPMKNVKGIGRLLVRWIGLPLIWTQKGQWLKLALLVASLWLAAVFVVRDRDEPRADDEDDDDTETGGIDDEDAGDFDGASGADVKSSAATDDAFDDGEDFDDGHPDQDGGRKTPRHPEEQRPSGPLQWKPRATGLRRFRRARHRRPLRPMEFVRACALRLGIVAVGAAALLVPTARAALSATTTDTGSTWSTAADFSSCSAAAWDSTTVYHAGDVVAYNDDTWEAQWYTVGDEPGAPGSTMWSDLGSCSPPPPGTCSTVSWNVNVAYHKGDLVSYAGDTWRARFYSVGATPGAADQYGPWTDLGPCTS